MHSGIRRNPVVSVGQSVSEFDGPGWERKVMGGRWTYRQRENGIRSRKPSGMAEVKKLLNYR